MDTLYPLPNLSGVLPDAFPSSPAFQLVGHTTLAVVSVLKDQVDTSLKRVCSGLTLALRASVYGTSVSQSSIFDFMDLFRAMEGCSDCSSLLEKIE